MNIFTLDPAVKKLLGWKISDEEEKWSLVCGMKYYFSLIIKLLVVKSFEAFQTLNSQFMYRIDSYVSNHFTMIELKI